MDLAGALLVGSDPELYALKEAGKRMADVLNAQVVFGKLTVFGRWMAFRLEDGTSPDHNTVYATRAEAISHQRHNEGWCHFECLRPASYSADECALTLLYARHAYQSGWRPDMPAPIAPVRLEDRGRKLRQLATNGRRNHR